MPGMGQALSRLSVAGKALLRSGAPAAGGALIRGISQQLSGKIGIPPGADNGEGRHYRRMNPLNPKALRRALRRAKGFEHFARKVMHLTHRKPGTMRFKFPRRRRK